MFLYDKFINCIREPLFEGGGGARWGSDSGASKNNASNHHHLSTTPQIPREVNILDIDRVSGVESDEL